MEYKVIIASVISSPTLIVIFTEVGQEILHTIFKISPPAPIRITK